MALVWGTQPAPAASNSSGAATSGDNNSDIVLRKVTLWSFKGSRLSAEGTSERLAYDRTAGAGHGSTAQATLSPAHPRDRANHFQAGEVDGHLGPRTVDAAHGVTLTRDDGTAVTDSAHYDGVAHLLSGSEPIDGLTPRFRIHGQSFTIDTATEQVEVFGPVEGSGRVSR